MKKKFKKKLVLNKTTLANLNNEEMNHVYGASGDGSCTEEGCPGPTDTDLRTEIFCGTRQRACDPGTVAVTCGCNTLTDC